MKHRVKKNKMLYNILIFITIMLFTVWSVFHGQNLTEIINAAKHMRLSFFVLAILLALMFVAGEGSMIYYLLKGIGENTTFIRCVSFSFIGFFFSGLTPSATGGQPMQLYYMKKDGIKLASSSAVLMTVAIVYKFVLVITGLGIYVIWRPSLKTYLGGYYWLYFVGLFLNVILVALLLTVMFVSQIMKNLLCKIESKCIAVKLMKPSSSRSEKINQFFAGYENTVTLLKKHKKWILTVVIGTFLQRCCLFILTYVIYCGFGLKGESIWTITMLQAAIYVAVDMLPLPGAQGITEAMYKSVFQTIFTGQYLVASMCITRGISFYFVMIISLLVWGMTILNKNVSTQLK